MRRPHLGGSLGAALLQTALKRQWVTQDLDSRALALTALGRKEVAGRFGVELPLLVEGNGKRSPIAAAPTTSGASINDQ